MPESEQEKGPTKEMLEFNNYCHCECGNPNSDTVQARLKSVYAQGRLSMEKENFRLIKELAELKSILFENPETLNRIAKENAELKQHCREYELNDIPQLKDENYELKKALKNMADNCQCDSCLCHVHAEKALAELEKGGK